MDDLFETASTDEGGGDAQTGSDALMPTAVDLQALAEAVLALMKRELRLERERLGDF